MIDWIDSIIKYDGCPSWIEHGVTGQPYPEISGYIIPTLLRYGRIDAARRLVQFLCNVQNDDGSFMGLDRTGAVLFDTSAAYEGLCAARDARIEIIPERIVAAYEWMMKTIGDRLPLKPSEPETNVYLLRTAGLLGLKDLVKPFLPSVNRDVWYGQRLHYIGYALEGLDKLGYTDEVKKVLDKLYAELVKPDNGYPLMPWSFVMGKPFGTDTCATCQLLILFHKYQYPGEFIDMYVRGVKRMVDPGYQGISHNAIDDRKTTWTAKYYLDLMWSLEHA